MRTDLRRILGRRLKGKRFACKYLTTGPLSQARYPQLQFISHRIWLTKILDQGDPMDTSIKLRPLEPASGQALARDLVLKTRRRKGLGDQIAVSKYLDDEFVVSCRFVTLSHYPDPGAALGPGMIFVHKNDADTSLSPARTLSLWAC